MHSSIDYMTEKYCEGCVHQTLEIVEDRLIADNHTVIINHAVQCKHAGLCANLWEHLLDWEDEHGDDDDNDIPPDDNPDWSFSPDATYEDRQIR